MLYEPAEAGDADAAPTPGKNGPGRPVRTNVSAREEASPIDTTEPRRDQSDRSAAHEGSAYRSRSVSTAARIAGIVLGANCSRSCSLTITTVSPVLPA